MPQVAVMQAQLSRDTHHNLAVSRGGALCLQYTESFFLFAGKRATHLGFGLRGTRDGAFMV